MVDEQRRHSTPGTPEAPRTDAFANRLRKNARHFRRWAQARGLTAYRVYDRDIPEFSYAVDIYGDCVLLVEYPRRQSLRTGTLEDQRATILTAVEDVLGVPKKHVFTKTHLPKAWGREQYGKTGQAGERFSVQEGSLKFWVNLSEYLDTGLFMDHRNTRARVREEARGKRFLNLFAYTGTFTVAAAAGGATSTLTLDLSNTYLDWAEDNLALNGLADARHTLLRADCTAWLAEPPAPDERFDLVVLDPPSHSTSKRMAGTFNVQRDHVRLLEGALGRLALGGTLYFSTNFLGFQLHAQRLPSWRFEELTPHSIPEDFQRKDIHRCWRVTAC